MAESFNRLNDRTQNNCICITQEYLPNVEGRSQTFINSLDRFI